MGRGLSDSALSSFQELPDEEIILLAKDGSIRAAEYLLKKYKSLVEGKSRSYFLAGADHEDVVQEGMIGLFKAIRDFRADKPARFRVFAEMCVTRQILTAVKAATRQKHLPLNRYISLHRNTVSGDSSGTLMDVLPNACIVNPEEIVLDSLIREQLNSGTHTELSELESGVLSYYMQGMSYQEMAALLSCHPKSVDNALQRAKRKVGDRIVKRVMPT